MHNIDSRYADFLNTTPAPGDDPASRLTHTLACNSHCLDTWVVSGAAFTWGDLRQLAAGRRTPALMAAARRDVADAEFVATATVGVYGDEVRTGLTWADLRALLA